MRTGTMAKRELPDGKKMLASHNLGEEDLDRIRTLSKSADVELLVKDFYVWLEVQPEYRQYFSDLKLLNRVKHQQEDYWRSLLEARVDESYIRTRILVGETHARIKLGIYPYFAAMSCSASWLVRHVHDTDLDPDEKILTVAALMRLIKLDSAIVISTIAHEQANVIVQQSRSLMELSTPAIKVWEGILLLPLVGVIDSMRASQVMEGLLNSIVETESEVAILDVTGVPIIDTYVAQHLMHAVSAAGMLGAQVILTGFGPEAAQTLTRLGVDLRSLTTAGTLRAGIAQAFRMTGRRVVKVEPVHTERK
jgi:rsbT co-antagonist protein RsbR